MKKILFWLLPLLLIVFAVSVAQVQNIPDTAFAAVRVLMNSNFSFISTQLGLKESILTFNSPLSRSGNTITCPGCSPGAAADVVTFNTAASTCSATVGSCTASPSCGTGGGPCVIATHGLGTSQPWVDGYDGSGNLLGGATASTFINDVHVTSANAATITFSAATSGVLQISTGSQGPAGSNGAGGAGYLAASTTSITPGTGSITITTQPGLAYSIGACLQIVSAGTPSAFLTGPITAANIISGSLTFTATAAAPNTCSGIGGSGAHTDWNLSIAGSTGSSGTNGTNGTGFTYIGSFAGRPGSPATNDTMLFTGVATTGVCPPVSTGSAYAQCTWSGSAFVGNAGSTGGGGASITAGTYAGLPGTCTTNAIYKLTDSVYDEAVCLATNVFTFFAQGKQMYLPSAFSWSQVNFGSSTVATTHGGILLAVNPVSGANLVQYVHTAPATPYTATAYIVPQIWGAAGDFASSGIVATDGTKIISLDVEMDGTGKIRLEVVKWNNFSTLTPGAVATKYPSYQNQAGIWLQVNNTGTNLIWSWSADGIQFDTLFSEGSTAYLSAVTSIGIGGETFTTTGNSATHLISWQEH